MASRRSPGSCVERLVHRVAGRLDGEEHVGAGVAVGHRVDVEGVDLLAGGREALDGQVGEPAYGVQIEGGNVCLGPHPSYPLPWRGSR